jgi:hypothetical protein
MGLWGTFQIQTIATSFLLIVKEIALSIINLEHSFKNKQKEYPNSNLH